MVPSSGRKKTLAGAAVRAHQHLMAHRGHAAYQYLTEERGLTDATLTRFMVGLVPDDDPDFGDKAGWISLPNLTPSGPVTIRYRRPPGSTDPAKYKSMPGHSPRLFNTTAILTAQDTLCVTEGAIDCMSLAQCGLHAVGLESASSWNKPFALAVHGFDNIIVCEDGDDDGAGSRLSQKILADIDWAKVVRFEGCDVNDYMNQYGQQALWQKVMSAVKVQPATTEREGEE